MFSKRILKTNNSNSFFNINAVYSRQNGKLGFYINTHTRSLTNSTDLQTNKNALGPDSSIIDRSSSSVIKAFQLLRTKPKGYDDFNFMLDLSNKTLGSLALLKAHELADICEILCAHKYRNILLMHGISESFYWLCKVRKVKLRELSRFLKSCFILRYIPNVRYLDVFFKELDDSRHVKSVGDRLRFLQFLVHSDLWMSEKYIKLYLNLYEYCTKHMGLMYHSHISSFSQTQLLIDDSDSDVFEMVCLNFERDLKNSEVSHLRMLTHSLLNSTIKDMPTPFARVLKYYLTELRDSLTPQCIVDVLNLLSKFHYRDTECLNKIGHIISDNVSNYSFEQLSSSLNQFASLSYKHKQLIISVSHTITGSSNSDLFSKFALISSLSNLISKVKYQHISSINSVSTSSTNALSEIENSHSMLNDQSTYWSNVVFRPVKQKFLPPNRKSIITTDCFLEDNGESDVNKTERPRRSILRKLKRNVPIETNSVDKDAKLKFVPESTDIISSQSLSEYFNSFYSTFFNGFHPASKRLNNRRMMKQQLEKYKRGPDFESSKTLSNVYYEMKHDNNVNSSIKRIKYKIKYSGSKIVQPSTFYINQVKLLKRCFLSPFLKISSDSVNGDTQAGLNKCVPIYSLVGKNSLVYVDNKLILRPYHKKYRFKYKTIKEFQKIMKLNNKFDSIIKYYTDNDLWSYNDIKDHLTSTQLCIVDYVANIMSSLSRLNYVSFHLIKSLTESFLPKSLETFLIEYERDGSSVDLPRFVLSINKIFNSLASTILSDNSGIILSKLTHLTCSQQFNALMDSYLNQNQVEFRLCYKILDNLCRISFYSCLKKPTVWSENTGDSTNELSNGNENQNLINMLYTISKVICKIDNQGQVELMDVYDESFGKMMNIIVYTSWLSILIKDLHGNDKNITNCELENCFSDKILGTSSKYISKMIHHLDNDVCDTKLIQVYMDILNRYRELVKFNKELKGVEFEGVGEHLENDHKNMINIEESYMKMMNKYKLGHNMITNEDQILCEIKNKMIPKYKFKNTSVKFYNNASVRPPLLYYYYYNYYCNI